jgi:chromosome segregation ATPase
MNKILKTRQAEYERSLAKHAELYPSVPEMQNMSRMKYAGHVANLDLQIQKIQRNADAIAEAISQVLVGSVREGEMRTSVTSPSFQIHPQQEGIIELKAENAELKSKFHQLQASWEQERAEHLKVLRQMQEEMKKMEKMRTEMKNLEKDKEKELEAAKKLKEETERNVKDVKDQLSRMQKDHQQTSDELAARLSKQEQASVKATQDCGDIKAFVDREASAWKSAISDITNDISELTSRVESLSTPPAQDVSEAANIDSNVVADLTRQIKEHESKLSRLDADALERVAETIDIKIPALESKLSSLQEKVDIGIPEALDKKEQDIFKQVVNYVQIMSEYLGKKVDSINDALKGIKNRVEALEQASTSGQTASINNDQLQQLMSEVSSLNSKLEACEQAMQKLDKELRNQIQQANQATSTLGQDLNGQLDAVRQSLFVLNSQYNNLTTRSLAEHIIGYLRQMYPQSDQLIADIKALNVRVGAVQADLEGIKVKYDERSLAPESNDAQMETMLRLQEPRGRGWTRRRQMG